MLEVGILIGLGGVSTSKQGFLYVEVKLILYQGEQRTKVEDVLPTQSPWTARHAQTGGPCKANGLPGFDQLPLRSASGLVIGHCLGLFPGLGPLNVCLSN